MIAAAPAAGSTPASPSSPLPTSSDALGSASADPVSPAGAPSCPGFGSAAVLTTRTYSAGKIPTASSCRCSGPSSGASLPVHQPAPGSRETTSIRAPSSNCRSPDTSDSQPHSATACSTGSAPPSARQSSGRSSSKPRRILGWSSGTAEESASELSDSVGWAGWCCSGGCQPRALAAAVTSSSTRCALLSTSRLARCLSPATIEPPSASCSACAMPRSAIVRIRSLSRCRGSAGSASPDSWRSTSRRISCPEALQLASSVSSQLWYCCAASVPGSLHAASMVRARRSSISRSSGWPCSWQ